MFFLFVSAAYSHRIVLCFLACFYLLVCYYCSCVQVTCSFLYDIKKNFAEQFP